jgi:hypothetical protein
VSDQSPSSTSTAAPPPVKTRKLSRTRGAASGILLVLLGAWGALAPFIGPSFSFGYTEDKSWTWTAARGWYEVLPGAAAFLGGLLLLFGTSRALTVLGAWFGILAGAWFVIGPPLASELTLGSLGAPRGSSSGQRAAETLALFSGLGAVIIFLAATAFGRLSVVTVRDQRVAERREQDRIEAEEVANREAAERDRSERDRFERERYERENATDPQNDTRAYGEPVQHQGAQHADTGADQPSYPASGYQQSERPTPYTPPAAGRHDENTSRGSTASTETTQGEPTTGYTPGYSPPPTER